MILHVLEYWNSRDLLNMRVFSNRSGYTPPHSNALTRFLVFRYHRLYVLSVVVTWWVWSLNLKADMMAHTID